LTLPLVRTNENIGAIVWRDEIIAETGGDFLLMHVSLSFSPSNPLSPRTPREQYGDLYEMLLRVALEAGVEIRYGAKVSQVFPGEEFPLDGLLPRSVNDSGSVCSPSSNSSCSDPATSAPVTGHGPPSVKLVNGEVLTADVIIGADGSRSIVRELLLDPEQDHGVESGYTAYS
jgi:salicylate hydroxylase